MNITRPGFSSRNAPERRYQRRPRGNRQDNYPRAWRKEHAKQSSPYNNNCGFGNKAGTIPIAINSFDRRMECHLNGCTPVSTRYQTTLPSWPIGVARMNMRDRWFGGCQAADVSPYSYQHFQTLQPYYTRIMVTDRFAKANYDPGLPGPASYNLRLKNPLYSAWSSSGVSLDQAMRFYGQEF